MQHQAQPVGARDRFSVSRSSPPGPNEGALRRMRSVNFGQASRISAQWSAKTPPGVVFLHWSAEETLAPGAAVRLSSFYGAR